MTRFVGVLYHLVRPFTVGVSFQDFDRNQEPKCASKFSGLFGWDGIPVFSRVEF